MKCDAVKKRMTVLLGLGLVTSGHRHLMDEGEMKRKEKKRCWVLRV